MRIIAAVALWVLLVIAGLAGLTYYASRESVTSVELAPSAVIKLPAFEPPHRNAGATPASLKVVSYNIGYASGEKNNQGSVLSKVEVMQNLDTIVQTLEKLDPDIICLQEVDFKAGRTHNVNQLENLAERLKMPYAAYVVTWNKNYVAWPYWPPQHQFGAIVSGQAVLSRYPIVAQDLLHFAKPPDNSFWYNWFYLDRVAQRLRMTVGDRDIQLWNIHLEAFSADARQQQLEVMAKILQHDAQPLMLVAGDFNTDELTPFESETGLHQSLGSPMSPSFPSWDPRDAIDHILFEGLPLEDAGVTAGISASDHLPVWAEFKL